MGKVNNCFSETPHLREKSWSRNLDAFAHSLEDQPPRPPPFLFLIPMFQKATGKGYFRDGPGGAPWTWAGERLDVSPCNTTGLKGEDGPGVNTKTQQGPEYLGPHCPQGLYLQK